MTFSGLKKKLGLRFLGISSPAKSRSDRVTLIQNFKRVLFLNCH